ncbi:hypothetical protein FG078_17855 [Vibrio cholerae]|nr:hypothetical protein [Vibrio cholerae]EGR0510647.1 hypothetical protein [Vibrio cholerae]
MKWIILLRNKATRSISKSKLKISPNKRLKRDCQRVAFSVPLSRGGFGGCVWVWLLCVVSPLGGRYAVI